MMAKSKPGDPGQAGAHDSKKGGKYKPTTKATPPSGNPHEGHGHKGTPQKK